jgi:hypothetical protein
VSKVRTRLIELPWRFVPFTGFERYRSIAVAALMRGQTELASFRPADPIPHHIVTVAGGTGKRVRTGKREQEKGSEANLRRRAAPFISE